MERDTGLPRKKIARGAGVEDVRTRTTIRNLRIREDTAKYLLNLDPSSAHYDPKTRSMRGNPYGEVCVWCVVCFLLRVCSARQRTTGCSTRELEWHEFASQMRNRHRKIIREISTLISDEWRQRIVFWTAVATCFYPQMFDFNAKFLRQHRRRVLGFRSERELLSYGCCWVSHCCRCFVFQFCVGGFLGGVQILISTERLV